MLCWVLSQVSVPLLFRGWCASPAHLATTVRFYSQTESQEVEAVLRVTPGAPDASRSYVELRPPVIRSGGTFFDMFRPIIIISVII